MNEYDSSWRESFRPEDLCRGHGSHWIAAISCRKDIHSINVYLRLISISTFSHLHDVTRMVDDRSVPYLNEWVLGLQKVEKF